MRYMCNSSTPVDLFQRDWDWSICIGSNLLALDRKPMLKGWTLTVKRRVTPGTANDPIMLKKDMGAIVKKCCEIQARFPLYGLYNLGAVG